MQGVSIFLVEDEALIRMMIVEMLEGLGHRVVAEAGSIQTAEPLARTSVFDLAVFDINVAGFNIQWLRAGRAASLVQGQAGAAQAILDFSIRRHDPIGSN